MFGIVILGLGGKCSVLDKRIDLNNAVLFREQIKSILSRTLQLRSYREAKNIFNSMAQVFHSHLSNFLLVPTSA